MPNANGHFTVDEYQEMRRSGIMKSGRVDLLPPFNAPIEADTTYIQRDGGTVHIVGLSGHPDYMWARSGVWYYKDTGKALNESGFLDISRKAP